MVERQSEVDKVLELLMEGNKVGVVESGSGEVIGIRGMGGLGKTVLAQAVALHISKSRQVIWLDVGETPDRSALINILIKVLGGTVSFSDIHAAQAWLKANTCDKDCLIVLDDVWGVDDAAVFDYLSGNCQLLITTRDANVVNGLGGSVYELETMAADQSRALLYKYACITPYKQSKLSSNMQEIVSKLLDQCGGLPLALALVGSNLKDVRAEQAWRDILQDFEKADLERLRSLFPTDAYPHRNLLAAINVSFQRLEESAREKFLDFAIFPEDTDIPSDVLEQFWLSIGTENGRAPCDPRESRYILAVLERKSLIQKGPELQGKTSYRVHDLLLDFARAKLRATGTLTDVQRVFAKTLRGQCVNGEWTTTSSTSQKDYYFKYLPYHFHSSKQHSELIQLLFDFHWLEQKVKHNDLPSLISDFRFLDTPLQHEIKLLKKSLMLSAEAIEKNPSSIGPQLLDVSGLSTTSYKEVSSAYNKEWDSRDCI
ncbi:WD repeat [Paramuricea clavata]|uniref:WD repeat n=1 Tax=Paramuricea clavata TaxID=317549 RepID=A0A6S7H075_PARCT|nr:WD repeat [Paramuricea clavata]